MNVNKHLYVDEEVNPHPPNRKKTLIPMKNWKNRVWIGMKWKWKLRQMTSANDEWVKTKMKPPEVVMGEREAVIGAPLAAAISDGIKAEMTVVVV